MSSWVMVGRLSDLPPGRMKVVRVGEARIVVANLDGKLFAVEDRCSHDDGPLGEGVVRGRQIECPRHGARFDLESGRPVCLPAVVPIATYPVRVVGEEIQVGPI